MLRLDFFYLKTAFLLIKKLESKLGLNKKATLESQGPL